MCGGGYHDPPPVHVRWKNRFSLIFGVVQFSESASLKYNVSMTLFFLFPPITNYWALASELGKLKLTFFLEIGLTCLDCWISALLAKFSNVLIF